MLKHTVFDVWLLWPSKTFCVPVNISNGKLHFQTVWHGSSRFTLWVKCKWIIYLFACLIIRSIKQVQTNLHAIIVNRVKHRCWSDKSIIDIWKPVAVMHFHRVDNRNAAMVWYRWHDMTIWQSFIVASPSYYVV